MGSLSIGAKGYIGLTTLIGLLVFAGALSHWQGDQPVRFLFYLAGGVLTSNLKVRLPGITGTMSVNFLFILIGILELGLPQTLMIACVGALAQSLWHAKNGPKPVQLLFTWSSITITTACSYAVYHSPVAQSVDNSLPVLLFIATAIYFLVNTLSVSMVIALTEGKNLWRVWRESFAWTAPQYLVGAALAGVMHVINQYAGWQLAVFTLPVIYFVYRSYDLYLGRLEEEKKHVSEMADLHWRTIEALALAIDAKDDTTHDHLRRVHVYATEIGKELKMNDQEMKALQASALLHDIGKLAVPEHIISKPGKLTPEEFEKMKIHPVVGGEILERVRFPYPVVPIVRSHHEKWNGMGYPDGLQGEQIPVGARILAVVDCLDALASDRQYRRALPLEKAMEMVNQEAGISFDPKIVAILQRRYVELERMAKASPLEESKLSTNAKIERGIAPAAGFESCVRPDRDESGGDFLSSIVAARQEFQMLLQVLNELGSSLSLEDTLSVLAVRLKRMIPHDAIAIYVCKDGKLAPQFVTGEDFRLFSSLEIPLGQGLSGWVAENRKPIVNGNPSVEPGYLNDPRKVSRMRSALSVPLDGLDSVVGALTLYHSDGDAFTKDHLRVLLAVSSKAGLTIENALKYRRAEHSAVADEVTGLLNTRSLFLQLDRELALCKRNGTPLAVLTLDVEGFRRVNDRFGHLAGNKVLQAIGAGLKEVCREYDYVARIGGDEFVVVFPGVKGDVVQAKMQQFRQVAATAGHVICGEDLLSMSFGEASYPDDGSDAEQLLAEADRRMYQSKQTHRCAILPVLLSEAPSAAVMVH